MNTPPLLLGAAILFWGWQTGYWGTALAVAAALETHRLVALRWDFTQAQLYRIADFCTVLLLVLALYLYFSYGNPRAITQLFQWSPMVLLPLVLAQAYGATADFDLGVLFWSLRKQLPRRPLRVNLGYPYFLLWIIAASAANNRSAAFYAGLIVLAAWALWRARPRGFRLINWTALLALAAALGFGAHVGLSQLQAWLEAAAPEWLSGSGARTDPYKNTTDIGHIGELKQSDRIVLRVAPETTIKPPILLHRASYDVYFRAVWLARNGAFAAVETRPDAATWQVRAARSAAALTVHDYSAQPNPLLSLPAGTLRIEQLAASALKRNPLGTVQAEHRPGFFTYRVRFDPGQALDGSPTRFDLRVPRDEQVLLTQLVATIGLAGLEAEQIISKVQSHFADNFQYAAYGKRPAAARTALADFLLHSKAGHCEYFASATVLLLRAAGVPARYATGFSAQEFSRLENAYLVRERHAHAWTKAYVNGAWRDVDTTPPVWFVAEQEVVPWWAPLADFWSWVRFKIAQAAAAEEPSLVILAWIALPLLGWVAWRLYRGRRMLRRRAEPAPAEQFRWPGQDSEFYLIEKRLGELGWGRNRGETPIEWLERISAKLPADFENGALILLARLHYRYRFDPMGLSAVERERLKALATSWLHRHAAAAP